MKFNSLSLVTALIYAINTCNAVKFKVICTPADFGGTGVNAIIDGTSYPMTAQPNDILYELDYPNTPKQYYYEITGNQTMSENVLFNGNQRQWTDPQSTTTLYEVYGRRYTIGDDMIKTIPRLYQPLEGYEKYSQLFQEGEVPVIHVKMNDLQYTQLTTTENKEAEYKVEFDFYTPYEKYFFTNVTLSLSGQGSMDMDKKPYKFDLSKGDADKSNTEIYNRKEFKLRSLRYDESYIKNKLASDIAESLGLPITQASFCRLYINNKSYGLYELTDMYKKKFVKRFFGANAEDVANGSLYKAVSGNYPAYLYKDFPGSTQTYDEDVTRLYENIVDPTTGLDPNRDIKAVLQWADTLSPTATKEEIEKQLDLDMFLKNSVLEYLICHWDGFLGKGNNYFVHVDPNNTKYHIFSYDFDLTFGKWCKAKEGLIENYILHVCDPDEDEKPPSYGPEPKRDPILYNKIILNPQIRPLFDDILKNVVQNLFNMNALGERINYLYEFLKYDMYWDIDAYDFQTFDTKYFGSGRQANPTRLTTDAQFIDQTDPENLSAYIKYKSESLAQLLNIPQLQSKGDFGEVGGKIITLGKDDKNDNKSDNDGNSGSGNGSSSSGSNQITTKKSSLLFTITLSILLILMIA
ncbi:coth-domain-containing protein [Anaeromyces robustus]|uniref:Coth-domain-containing protein n=1 Tax=Anaeromyces robustus TaxID=1754192 RepID=A0A1Y1XID6_9FUNG|nr:coth-domain-containing protein [Anaeromyces robustus]|eukprot:ORX85515.1 coth-domain-containing protein [Anaeromyces robustus]